MKLAWPSRLWIARHGESAGNVARELALRQRLPDIALDFRDADVPLSALGKRQSSSLGRWFCDLPVNERPDVVLVSPYVRAKQTAELVRQVGGLSDLVHDFVLDERLREKEFGILDRLTRHGIEEKHPDLADARSSWEKSTLGHQEARVGAM